MDVAVSLLAIFCLLLGSYCFRNLRSTSHNTINLPYAIGTGVSFALVALLLAMLIFGYNSHIVAYAFFLVSTVSLVVMCSYIVFLDPAHHPRGKGVALFTMILFGALLIYTHPSSK